MPNALKSTSSQRKRPIRPLFLLSGSNLRCFRPKRADLTSTTNGYGNATVSINTVTPAFGYCGYYVHARSGLNLTVHRAYNANLARFMNRDPIGENGGINLYGYVGGDPIGGSDPSGLFVYGTYSISNHTLKLYDSDSGESFISNEIFSGDPIFRNNPAGEAIPFLGPVPEGFYGILFVENARMPSHSSVPWFPLKPLSGPYGYRNGVGIHPGTISKGCITFKNDKNNIPTSDTSSTEFNRLKNFIENTVPISGYYGFLQVIK